jgi:WD40 repeat protein/serine/threonine protein kinase
MNERAIFAAALDITDPAERVAYLNQACGGNSGLRRHIEELLAAQDKLGSFLARPPGMPPATGTHEPITERPGTRIGPYKLLQQIGEGGMGVVYMAEQDRPIRRRVALKIIKPGMDTGQVVARFEAERQALALMDHQNIAKVLDAGSTEGSRSRETSDSAGTLTSSATGHPYFVMELVHGVPITKFCDDNHRTPKQRLELFLPVCHAVQHAHQKGIIHRDLKPSNVPVCLYDGVAVPKVIDFGVAKATGQQLTERTMFTQFGTLVGTLEYMSPEQAEMSQLGIDTRSDVYSLGVLLYELLTGTTPLERHRLREAGFDEIRRLIREEEPPKPSTRLSTSGAALPAISAQRQMEPAKLTRLVRGDLDWIVMQCLEKDRNRRYETANGLARDLERFLHDEPVEACPPTTGYKLRKFARKNKKLLATAAAFAAVLLLGVATSVWQAVRATQAEGVALAHEQQANQQRDEVRVLNDQLRRTLYVSNMSLAQHTWEAGSIERLRELLDQTRPKAGETDLRHFEWHYLYRLCHAEVLTLEGHTGGVLSVVYGPNGRRLASAAWDGRKRATEVRVWDAHTGKVFLTLNGAGSIVAYSPDGKRLASAASDAWAKETAAVKVWDAQTGQELLICKGPTGGVVSVAFSPDGKLLACGSANWDAAKRAYIGEVKLWDARTGQELHTFKGYTGPVSVAFSPDSKRLASAPYGCKVKICDAQTGQEVRIIEAQANGFYQTIAFSPDGQRLAHASATSLDLSSRDFSSSTIKVLGAQTGLELLSRNKPGQITSVVFSPDSKRLVTAAASGGMTGAVIDRTVRVWDAQTGEELGILRVHTNQVTSTVFSPDGSRLASASTDGTVKIWNATIGLEARRFRGPTERVYGMAFSPDGKRLASVAGDKAVRVWDAQTGQEVRTLKGHTDQVYSAVFSPDGKHLASASRDKTVKVWDAQTGQEVRTLQGHADQVYSAVFSPDGKRLATSTSKEVKVRDVQTGQELRVLKGYPNDVARVAYSPDGKRLVIATADERTKESTVIVCDALTGQELLSKPDSGPGVAFSPDGKRLASTVPPHSAYGPPGAGEVKIWDAQSGDDLLTLKGHTSYVLSVVFSPDGKRLASSGPMDGSVKVWDALTGQELLSLKGGRNMNNLAFSPNGHWLVADPRGRITIWDATPVPEKP